MCAQGRTRPAHTPTVRAPPTSPAVTDRDGAAGRHVALLNTGGTDNYSPSVPVFHPDFASVFPVGRSLGRSRPEGGGAGTVALRFPKGGSAPAPPHHDHDTAEILKVNEKG
jgi:hypothetical protein